ncbi:glycerophosphodiester phosphodiesterase [Salinibius halmophilus]|uniref:glycerophosphodiester phosphodiesterase n=1 Tax=Salinibius halmophilus TaxID=1853216 RepID=UPI000E6662E9|nr:glycerophosphodiester phosphodiesterase family protein [Salinibius halmophilus]
MSTLLYPRLISHRGANTLAAENTLDAFELAAKQGATWVEFDVCLAKDGTPVIFHDQNMQRLANINNAIADFTYSELKDIPLLFNGEPSASRVPTLGQTLALSKRLGMTCNIELKPQTQEEAWPLAETVSDWLESYDGDCVVSSFSAECLLRFKQCSDRPVAALAPQMPEEWRDIIKLLDPVAIHLSDEIADWPTVRELRAVNLPIAVWTVNSATRLAELLNFGATSIFTDDLSLYPAGSAATTGAPAFAPLFRE